MSGADRTFTALLIGTGAVLAARRLGGRSADRPNDPDADARDDDEDADERDEQVEHEFLPT